ncbi:acyl-CoA dehydrogenase C-terminal domain-containing protein [Marivibrio halodurans]|uniref:3-methylmercaptopropionyl-CoA dehydrogenase n=2 Tax=Marivibrio halodurans TaxID=2039722 RepID=A0A8J7V1K1_9PROT|nr:acyl-CoA dehydrogenase C-terminal domain-containing protein [Marivibrio halodurans]MBP5856440.1 acyl-CoA dehydrogenase C-terminal domain-containing protein [Marivibrio halodurans]
MVPYNAPIADMRFVLKDLGLLGQVQQLHGGEEITPDLVEAVLEEAGKLARDVLAPINHAGDRQHSRLENGVVRTPDGYAEAYRAYVEGGWNSVPFEADYGGQDLPWTIATAVQEMWQSANLAFGLCPILNQGAVEALQAHGSEAQKQLYLPRMISGEWTGTMNLTEPQAGSDLSQVKTRAERREDHYRIRGQKIYITYGEHDLAENIVHLVLARCDDAPEGVKGISLFIVPKFLPDETGAPGQRNDVRCVSLERKLGINGSPTCVMAYGDDEGAVGYLVGEENRGLEYMFTMMNNARLAVGVQGLAAVERAYQQARDYARERRQGRAIDGTYPAAIIRHADIRRMLMTMRAYSEAMRALILDAMLMQDTARRHPEESYRLYAKRRVGVLTPVVKGWCTDMAVELTSMGVQVHGGMGYIEETGAAQHFRDSRILPIYEGTNGIQANDLVGRKLIRDGGEAIGEYIDELHALINGLNERGGEDMAIIRRQLALAVDHLDNATGHLLEHGAENPDAAHGAAAYYMRLFGLTAGGAMMARAAIVAQDKLDGGGEEIDRGFYEAKLATALFYAENILPLSAGLVTPIARGPASLRAIPDEAL